MYLVFQQGQNSGWVQITPEPVDAPTADAAIEAARTTAGTFVAVLVRGFRPRTHYAAPRPPAAPKPATPQVL
jgi:hypothetical protein